MAGSRREIDGPDSGLVLLPTRRRSLDRGHNLFADLLIQGAMWAVSGAS